MKFKDGNEFVKNLVTVYCPEPTVSNTIRLQTYFKKSQNMYNISIDFLKQGNNARAYIELMRFSQLSIKFSEHNAYNEKQYQREKNLNKRRLNNAILKLEELKPKIVSEYNSQIKLETENASSAALTPQNNQNSNLNLNSNNNNNSNDIQENENKANSDDDEQKKEDKSNLPPNQRWNNLLIPSAPPNNNNDNNNNSDNNDNNNNDNSGIGGKIAKSLDNIFNQPSLQPITIPSNTVQGFINYASSNTKRDIETCGVLCGKYLHDSDSYIISHVIVPKQKGTANTVQTLHEEELIGIQEKYSIIQLGWIHTHPSQSCFLSSVDMHCQLSYQIMMPNGIAIVHAPTDKTQVFSLTKKGIDILSKCNCQGFHRHEGVRGIYDVAKHIQWSNKHKISFIDLRNIK